MKGSAVFSPDGRYRYRLDRRWGYAARFGGLSITWLMLNPSTADAEQDDPTIRRCIGFSKAWGYGALTIVNLFAWRATDPRDLPHRRSAAQMMSPSVSPFDAPPDPYGPDWEKHLADATAWPFPVLCAWGARGGKEGHDIASVMARQPSFAGRLFCLGLTQDGSPRHPLYLAGSLEPEPFEPREVSHA